MRAGAAPLTWDDAWYLETSFRLADALGSGPIEFLSTYVNAFRFKAPLISLLPLPLFAVCGKTHACALAVNAIALIALGYYTYRIAGRFFGETAGLLAVLALNTMPLCYGLSRLFYVEVPLAVLVAAWMHHLLASDGLRRPGHDAALGAILGLGMLAKVLFPVYILAPTALLLWDRRRAGTLPDAAALKRATRLILGLGAAIALTWYARNWLYAVGYAVRAGVGDLGAPYGSSSLFAIPAKLRFLKAVAHQAASWYYVWAGAALLAAWLLSPPGPRAGLKRLWANEAFRFLAAWSLPPLLLFSFQVAGELRYVVPLLPAAAVLLAGGLERVTDGRAWRLPILACFFLFPLDLFAHQSFGRSLLPHGAPLPYNGPPRERQDWGVELVVGTLARAQSRWDRPLMVMVVLEHPLFNANNLACEAARLGHPMGFKNLGHAQDSAEKALIAIKERDATHVLTVSGIPAAELPGFLNRVNSEVGDSIEAGRLPFKRLIGLRLREGVEATLYERSPAGRRGP